MGCRFRNCLRIATEAPPLPSGRRKLRLMQRSEHEDAKATFAKITVSHKMEGRRPDKAFNIAQAQTALFCVAQNFISASAMNSGALELISMRRRRCRSHPTDERRETPVGFSSHSGSARTRGESRCGDARSSMEANFRTKHSQRFAPQSRPSRDSASWARHLQPL